jgi:hypothetical protein
MKRLLAAILLACICALLAPAAFAQCVTGTITAELQTSGPFEGLWRYCVQISWDTPRGLSNVTLQCNFTCPAICNSGWAFESPAGQGDGVTSDPHSVPGDCTVDFGGEFNCQGNPSIGLEGPVVKWDALDLGDGCEPGRTGSATLCFFVDLPPEPDQQAPIVLVKNNQDVCQGMITGDCPQCPVGTEPIDWSQFKIFYMPGSNE